QRHHVCRTRHRGRRRQQRGRDGDPQGRAPRCPGDQRRPATEHPRLGPGQVGRHPPGGGGCPGDGRSSYGCGGPGVTGIQLTTHKTLMVFTGRAHPALAEAVAAELGTELVPTQAYQFANSEIYVRFDESVRGCDAFVIQSHTAPVNEKIMEHLIMVDALKRASAKRITVVLPFYGYARQDKKHRGREPISARLVADLFKTAGADRLMAVDLHTAQIQGFFDGPVDHLMALPILSRHVREKYGTEDLAI